MPECYSLKDTSAGSEADTEGSVIDDDNDITMDSLKNNIDSNLEMPPIAKISSSPSKEDQVVLDPSNIDHVNELGMSLYYFITIFI